ncbi:MAG: hypothetical protein ACJ8J7_16935 [Sulfurifustaceae bacterium]
MSLAVVAFYWLQAGVKDTATLSGVVVTVNGPEGVLPALWVIWTWAAWRYVQLVYERLSVIWGELLEDVYAEDQRIALRRAKKHASQLAKSGELTSDPNKKGAWADGAVTIVGNEAFIPTQNGGRKYSLRTTIRWGGSESPGVGTENFQMEITTCQLRWLRCRAWVYAVIALPAFSEHIVPLLLVLFVPFAPLVLSCWPAANHLLPLTYPD